MSKYKDKTAVETAKSKIPLRACHEVRGSLPKRFRFQYDDYQEDQVQGKQIY